MKPKKTPQSTGLLMAFFLFTSVLISAQTYIKTLPALTAGQSIQSWDAAALNDGKALIGIRKIQASQYIYEAVKLNQMGDVEGPAVNISSYTTLNNNLFSGPGNDGLYVGMWEGANFFRVKIKNDNTTEWLGLTPTPYTGKVYQSPTGNFYVINVLHLGTQIKLMKISSWGALLWEKIYNFNFPVGNSHHQNVIQTADGGVLVAFQAPPDSIAVLKLDGNGNQQWLKKIAAFSYNDIGTLQIGDTYFVGTPQASPIIHKFDLDGNKVGEIQTADYIRLIGTADGNLLLGSVDNTAGSDLSLKKFSPSGSLIWSKVYEKDDLGVYPRALRMMPDGGFLYVGDGAANQTLVLVVRTDANGNIAGGPDCFPDVTPPVIAGCPANISIFANQPTNMTWTPPTATDNCGTPILSWTHAVGETFQFGATTVTYTAKDAANNTATCAFTITITQLGTNQPDLTLTNLSVPSSGTVGSVVNFTYKLNNIGTATAAGNYVIGAYLSTDNAWSPNDVLAGTVPTGNTPINFNTTVPASITVPAGTSAGNYFLICVADNSNVIQESNENNNIVSAAFEVTGGGVPGTYCNSFSNFPWEDWIAKVKLGIINNASGKSMSSDFTSIATNLSTGSTPIELTTGFSYFTWDEYWRVWIDLNHDGDFTDTGETVFEGIKAKPANGTATSMLAGNINIPASAASGATRMRVSMKRAAYAMPCETLPFGEVEDYTVNIQGGPLQLADLELTATGNPTTVSSGMVHYKLTLTNKGPATAMGITVKHYNSVNFANYENVVPTGGNFTQPTRIWSIGSLGPNVSVTLDFDGQIVDMTTPQVDFFEVISVVQGDPDSSPGNDFGAKTANEDDEAAVSLNPAFAADLTLTNLIATDTVDPGQLIQFSYTDHNIGNLATQGFSFSWFISTDAQLSANDLPFGGGIYVPAFLPNESYFHFNTQAAPSNIAAGTYFLIVSLDPDNAIYESNENNNILAEPFYLTPGGGNGVYCNSFSNFPWEDWISRVKLGTLDNTSGKSTFSDFTGLSTNLQKGQSYTVTLTTGYSYFTWDEYWRVWIDFNHDGVFSTPNEVVQQRVLTAPAAGTATASVTGSINIPSSALLGTTRMRVSMKRNAFASSCETLPFGEIEDYTINIANSLTGGEGEERASNLHFEAVAGVLSVDLYGAYRQAEGVAEVVFEKSKDGENFLPLAALPGEVTDAVSASDDEPIEGFNYYRMLLNLPSGEVEISPVKVVSFVPVPDFTVFPNPATSVAHLNLKTLLGKRVHIKMLSLQGVLVKNIVVDEIENELLDVPLDGLPSGTYFLWLETPGRRAVSRALVVEREF